MTSFALHCFAQSPGVHPPLVLALVSAPQLLDAVDVGVARRVPDVLSLIGGQ